MKCPFCNQDMEDGNIVVAGNASIGWERNYETVSLKNRFLGKNRINNLSWGVSKVSGHRCAVCNKIILDLERKIV